MTAKSKILILKETDLARRVGLYFERMRHDDIPKYKLDEVGTYRIMGGTKAELGHTPLPELFQGQFIDALIFALKQPDFYADWLSSDVIDNQNQGYIEKTIIRTLKDLKN